MTNDAFKGPCFLVLYWNIAICYAFVMQFQFHCDPGQVMPGICAIIIIRLFIEFTRSHNVYVYFWPCEQIYVQLNAKAEKYSITTAEPETNF